MQLAREAVNEHHAEQKPAELAALGDFLIEHTAFRPDGRAPNPLRTIVEIGSYRGGTLWFWRRLAPHAKIIGIDRYIDCESCRRRRAHGFCPKRACVENSDVFMEADSRERGTINAVAREVGLTLDLAYNGGLFSEGAGIDLLFIDGDHSAEGIEADFQNYAPLLSAHGTMAIHDVAGAVAPQVGDGFELDAVKKFWHNVSKIIPQAFEIVKDDGGKWGGIGVIPKPD